MKRFERIRYSVWADGTEVAVASEDSAYIKADKFVDNDYSEVRIIRTFVYPQLGGITRTVETFWKAEL